MKAARLWGKSTRTPPGGTRRITAGRDDEWGRIRVATYRGAMSQPITLCAMNLPTIPFDERVRVAAAAGFDSIGLSLDQYRRARADGYSDARMRELLAEAGIRLAELEGTWDWVTGDAASREDTATILQAARELGCPQLTAVPFVDATFARRVAALRALAESAEEFGARVAFEFMPFSFVPTLAEAWDTVQATGRENCGLVLDSWHLQRTSGWESTLDGIPPQRLYSVQLCDAAPEAEADLREEARHRRLLPGPQSVELLERLAGLGFAGRVTVEVWSDELFAADPADASERLFAATVSAVQAAGRRD